jgi:hypothetical protein
VAVNAIFNSIFHLNLVSNKKIAINQKSPSNVDDGKNHLISLLAVSTGCDNFLITVGIDSRECHPSLRRSGQSILDSSHGILTLVRFSLVDGANLRIIARRLDEIQLTP